MMRHFFSSEVTKAVAGFVVGCALFVLPAIARAQAPAGGPAGPLGQGFGEQGQLVVSGEANAAFAKVNNGGWGLEIRPAADYFIMPSVTVGGVLGYGRDNTGTSGFLVGGRAGYVLNLTENLSVWARVGIAYNNVDLPAPAGSVSATIVTASLPIMYHPAPHFFIALAPYYDLNLSGSDGLGVAPVIGGWF